MGVPVVTSSVAANGVDVVPHEHLLVADDAQACAQAVLKLMHDRNERQRLSDAARARVMTHHHWPNSMRRMEAIIEGAMVRRHQQAQVTSEARVVSEKFV